MTSQQWREWIQEKLGISEAAGREMALTNRFPFDRLVEAWRKEFAHEKGYSVAFIPALIRNKRGLIAWVYSGGREPLWTGSDDARRG
jgi:hypothetical protein